MVPAPKKLEAKLGTNPVLKKARCKPEKGTGNKGRAEPWVGGTGVWPDQERTAEVASNNC